MRLRSWCLFFQNVRHSINLSNLIWKSCYNQKIARIVACRQRKFLSVHMGPSINYVTKIFRKTNISNSVIRTRTCVYQGFRNVSFSENFAYVLNGWSYSNLAINLQHKQLHHGAICAAIQRSNLYLALLRNTSHIPSNPIL